MLHNSYFQVLLEQSTSIMSILTSYSSPPAAAPYVTFETGEYGSTWVLTFDNPSGASTASLLASNPNKTGINT
jgi:hypothetical protein